MCTYDLETRLCRHFIAEYEHHNRGIVTNDVIPSTRVQLPLCRFIESDKLSSLDGRFDRRYSMPWTWAFINEIEQMLYILLSCHWLPIRFNGFLECYYQARVKYT